MTKHISQSTRVRSAYRAGILAARKDAALYGVPAWDGVETKHLYKDQIWGPINRSFIDAYGHEMELALDRFLATLTKEERSERDAQHLDNALVRRSKDPATARKLIEVQQRLAVLEEKEPVLA